MKRWRWWSDTLFKRLFALMWLALVVSHLVAFLVVTHHNRFDPTIHTPLPTFPSLPPLPGTRDAAPPQSGALRTAGLPMGLVLLDYAIRFVIIALAAWMGARWLAQPMRKLASAARTLGRSLERNDAPPQLDEHGGTVEVRETAHVFNEMSTQLAELVNARALLVAAISHDLRTPLTRIRMRLEASEGDPLAARSIADIREMDELIESSLEIFRGSVHAQAPVVTDVLALVQSLTDDLADLGQPVEALGLPALARVHPAALRRVVSNLVNNALRYGERAEVRVSTHGDDVEIVVDDHGPGIPEAQLEAVMRPFFRLEHSRNRATGGSGLGLYIARDLLARQGGTLRLSNRPEGGLRATITLPRV